jgi:hypothetical protein
VIEHGHRTARDSGFRGQGETAERAGAKQAIDVEDA